MTHTSSKDAFVFLGTGMSMQPKHRRQARSNVNEHAWANIKHALEQGLLATHLIFGRAERGVKMVSASLSAGVEIWEFPSGSLRICKSKK